MAKFSGFRTFKLGGTIEEVVGYLNQGLSLSLKELQAGLNNLTFSDNFSGQVLEITVPANTTTGFSHNLGVIPSQRVILKSTGYMIDDSVTPWTSKSFYLRNSHPTEAATVKILLLR